MPSSAVFDKFKHGQLHSGSKTGPKVKNRAQAIAIYLSEKRTEAKHGGKYPERAFGGPMMGPGIAGPMGGTPGGMMPGMPMPTNANVAQPPPPMGLAGGREMPMAPRQLADGGVASPPVPSSAEEANATRWHPADPNNLTPEEQNILLSPAYNPAGWTTSVQDKINSASSPLGPLRALGGVATPGVGNFNMGKQANVNPSPMARSEERSVMRGPIMSSVPGRTDAHKTNVPSGSYVVPADIVSGRGQGNTAAGMNVLQSMFKMGPYGSSAGSLRPGHSMPRPMAAPKMMKPMMASGGGKEGGHIGKPTPVHLAGGELVVPPENLMQVVHPNLKTAHSIMDKWVLKERAKLRKTLGKLPGPVRD